MVVFMEIFQRGLFTALMKPNRPRTQGEKMCSSYGRLLLLVQNICSGLDRGDAGVAKAPPEFGGSLKGRSLISAYRSLAITASTSGFGKLSTALLRDIYLLMVKATAGHSSISHIGSLLIYNFYWSSF